MVMAVVMMMVAVMLQACLHVKEDSGDWASLENSAINSKTVGEV